MVCAIFQICIYFYIHLSEQKQYNYKRYAFVVIIYVLYFIQVFLLIKEDNYDIIDIISWFGCCKLNYFEMSKGVVYMVRNIVRDVVFLSQKAEMATEEDKFIAKDLLDTLKANKSGCVGLAANMIGYNKAIICVSGGLCDFVMINPVITKKMGKYETEEGCLSLIGERKCVRYDEIEVDYLDVNFNKKHGKYVGFVAEIIQHEIDHINGIII